MSVADSWSQIAHWLRANAPTTAGQIATGAEPDRIRAVEASFPASWPDDLREWYTLQDGETSSHRTLPDWTILSLDEMADIRERYEDAPDAVDASDVGVSAGENAFVFLPSFVPIGDNGSAETLFVDLRPGSLFGCVTGFFFGDSDTHGPIWPSVTAMLDDVARSLETGRPCDGYVPSVSAGELDWRPEA